MCSCDPGGSIRGRLTAHPIAPVHGMRLISRARLRDAPQSHYAIRIAQHDYQTSQRKRVLDRVFQLDVPVSDWISGRVMEMVLRERTSLSEELFEEVALYQAAQVTLQGPGPRSESAG